VVPYGPMKRTHGLSLCALLSFASLAACMHTPPPMEPENSDEESSSDKPKKNPDALSPGEADTSNMLGSGSGSGSGVSSPKREHATIKDEGDKQAMACGGASVPNLLAVIAQTACEVPKATPDSEQPRDVKDALDVKVTVDLPKVAPGAKANVTLTLHNKGKVDLPLDFVADPEPHFDLELYTMKGARADNPAGAEPALPSSVTDQPAPDKAIARLTLSPGGTATLVLPWDAVKYKWASADRAKGALPGQHYPRDVAGPLPKGKYAIRVVTPLVGISEGSEHEISQPRTPIEVGGH
jgi:hypothetical protein